MKKALAIILATMAIVLLPAQVFAGTPASCGARGNGSKGQVLGGTDATVLQGDSCDAGKVSSTLKTVINIISFIAGIVAIIMVVIAGFRYASSGGDSNKVGAAKQSLIYAAVGLFFIALAQTFVRVIANSS